MNSMSSLFLVAGDHAQPVTKRLRRYRGITVLLAGFGLILAWCSTAQGQTAHLGVAINAVGSGFSAPYGAAVDASGDVFVADTNDNAVKEIVAVNGAVSRNSTVLTVGGGFSGPKAVALDGNGNIFVADSGNNAIKEMPIGCTASSCVTKLGGGFSAPGGVAVDGSGNVYVADTNNRDVKEMPAGCASSSCVTRLGGGGGGFAYAFTSPYGVAVDAFGNIYVADYGANAVMTMPSGCGRPYCVTTMAGGFNQPSGVALDSSNNIFVADSGNNVVKKMRPGCTTASYNNSSCAVTTLGGAFSQPSGMAIDATGNVFIADTGDSTVMEIAVEGHFPATAVGSTSSAISLPFTFDTGGAIGAPVVLTQGAPNLDFTDAGTGTCTTNGTAHNYNAGDTCRVEVLFKPAYPGLRMGGVELTTTGGAVIASAYVNGAGTGPQIVYTSNSAVTTINSSGSFSGPLGVAVDGAGNIFVASIWSPYTVSEIPSGCTTYSCVIKLGGEFGGQLTGLAVDGIGNIVVGELTNEEVYRMPPGCANSTCVTPLGPWGAAAVAVDGSGNIFATSEVSAYEIPAGCTSFGCLITLGGSYTGDFGVTVDGTGNIFVTDLYGVYEMPPGCPTSACVTTINSGYAERNSIAVDANGNAFVANGSIQVIPSGCKSSSCSTSLGANFSLPAGLAIDGNGNLLVGDAGDNSIKKLDLSDPPTLTFATTAVGQTSTDSPQNVTVSNDGNEPLAFSAVTAPANFALDATNACTSSTTLNAGQGCMLAVDFTPAVAGNPVTGNLTLTDNSLNASPSASQNISLTGVAYTSQPPASSTSLIVSPSTAAYGATVEMAASVNGIVNGAQGGPTPTGIVLFYANGMQLGAGTLNSSGVAAYSTQALGAGSYSVTANYQGSSIYPGSNSVAQALTINPAATSTSLTISSSPSTYGQAVAFSASVNGTQGGPVPTGTVVISANGTLLGTATLNSSGVAAITSTSFATGNYTISATFQGSQNFVGSNSAAQALVVNKAPLTVALGPPFPGETGVSVGYGHGNGYPSVFSNPSTLCQITQATGFVDGDGPSVINGSAQSTLSWGTNPAPPVGNYTLNCALGRLSATNYTFDLNTAPLAITVVPSVLTLKPQGNWTKYGEPIPALEFTAVGLVYGQTAKVLSGTPVLTTTATPQSGVGSYPVSINVAGVTAANYLVVSGANAELTIRPATLVARAINTVVKYGQPIPPLNYRITGFVNGDANSVVSGTAALATTAVKGSQPGTYPITYASEGLSADNYNIVYSGATLTIEQ